MSLAIRSGFPARKRDVWLRNSGSESAVYDPETQSVHFLNPEAMAIWVLCDGGTEPGEMVAAICELTGLPQDVVIEDVRRILSEFDEAKILTWEA